MSRLIAIHRERAAKGVLPKAAAKTAGSRGRFVTLEQTDKNKLIVIPNPQAIAELVAEEIHHLPTDILTKLNSPAASAELTENDRRYNVWGDDQVLQKILEDHFKQGWHWVEKSDVGQYNSGPILEAPDGNIYFHERYQTEAAAEDLIMGKNVSFDGAPENRTVAPKIPPVAAPVKAAWDESAAGVGAPDKKGPCNNFEGHTKVNGKCWNCRHDYQVHEEGKKALESKSAAKKATPVAPVLPETKAPAPIAPVSGGNPFKDWQTDTLLQTIEIITDDPEKFAVAKAEQLALEQMAESLASRPVRPEDTATAQDKAAMLTRVAAWMSSKRAGLAGGGGSTPINQDTGTVLEGDKSIPDGRDKVEDHTGINYPKTDVPSKFAGATPPIDQDNAKVLEGDKSVDQTPAEENHTGVTAPATETPTKVAAIDPPHDQDTGKVLEGDKSVAQTPADEDHTGVTKPATETPTKVASVMTTAKAVKNVEGLIEELQGIYIDAKPITKVNDTRPVREGVEAIYHATKLLSEALKVLQKQALNEAEQVSQEEKATKKPAKTSSLLSGLKLAAVEGEEEEDEPEEKKASTVGARKAFRSLVASATTKVAAAEGEKIADAISGFSGAYVKAATAAAKKGITATRKSAIERKMTGLREKIIRLAEQLGMTATFGEENSGGVHLNLGAGGADPAPVPTI